MVLDLTGVTIIHIGNPSSPQAETEAPAVAGNAVGLRPKLYKDEES